MMNLLKKLSTNEKTEKTAVKMTQNQKATTTVANVSGKIKTAAFGVATGAGVAGSMMIQNERHIKGRKARAEYHKRVEQVCTVAVGATIVGAGASIVQAVFDPEKETAAPKAEQPADPAPAAPVDPAPAAPKAEQPADPAPAAPVDPAPAVQNNQGNSRPKGQNGNNSSKNGSNNNAKAAK